MKIAKAGTGLFVATATITACGFFGTSMECTPFAGPEGLAQRPSPYDSVSVTVGDAEAKLCYSRPSAKGRLIFGGLVPYRQLWRTGANEATILHLSQAATIAGIDVSRGSYSIYTVPDTEEWTVVVNASTGQWGQTRDVELPNGDVSQNSYTDEVRAQEVGRAAISTEANEFTPLFTASFDAGDSGADLNLDWAATRIVVPIVFR